MATPTTKQPAKYPRVFYRVHIYWNWSYSNEYYRNKAQAQRAAASIKAMGGRAWIFVETY